MNYKLIKDWKKLKREKNYSIAHKKSKKKKRRKGSNKLKNRIKNKRKNNK